ncbi:unnamed protein product [Brassicogethes aeneus]|uniref:Fork-head domain-containing protein n=1 Tax=Brassicogethes aeneus TaxID=1431903 RepID=A0A9P0BCR1_BRAAE|nr:unnamed protein product [Brassicogethes aeneus]
MSPERAISPQYDVSSTPKLSVPGSPVAGTPLQDATSPFSLLLAVAQSQKNGDDDLTSLSWLHDQDVLKGMNINPSPSSSVQGTPNKSYGVLSTSATDSSESPADSSSSSPSSQSPHNHSHAQKNKHPHNIPYDPLIHTNNKPPYSFSCLIFMAIEDSPKKALPVKEIYAWILDHFPYFKNAPTGWKNSVRHNLSLNKCFQKVDKAPNLGKGSLWTVDQQYKPNLIQALIRSPFHPCANLNPANYTKATPKPQPTADENSMVRLPNPQLFPYLARKLAATTKMESEESLDERDAAAAMLCLKNGPKLPALVKDGKRTKWQVITNSPSQDHTYSAATSTEDESEDDRTFRSRTCRKIDFEDDEERRIKEGAETLLNLAGIPTRKRNNSQGSQHDGFKRAKSEFFDINDNDLEQEEEEEKMPFKPRLLRTKGRSNNNNNCKVPNNNSEDWSKHRRQLDISQSR